MEIYLVGGAVRDQLLGRPVKEKDWVVVGATPKEMLAKGYKQVGRDFPVFLHPITHEEYALARTERKTGKGYTQFECHTDQSVTLEADLQRRDLTINAMAMTLDGKIIDPYGGRQDLKNNILRHVSQAFVEDPVRVLRIARFAAMLCDFNVHPTTNELMHEIVAAGELDALVPERVWQELKRSLNEKCPSRFFTVLNEAGALTTLFPEIAVELGSAIKVLTKAVMLSESNTVRFAALFYHSSKDAIKSLCKRYRIPTAYQKLATMVCNHKEMFVHANELCAFDLLKLMEILDVFRHGARFSDFLLTCEAGLLSDSGEKSPSPQMQHLRKIYAVVHDVAAKQFLDAGFSGKILGEKLREARVNAIENWLKSR